MSLHEQLRELADTARVLPGDRTMLIEAADRLELVEGLYADQLEITRNWKGAAYSIAADILKAKEDKP